MKSAFTYIQAAFDSMDKAMEQLTNAGAEMHGVMAEVHREQKIYRSVESHQKLYARSV